MALITYSFKRFEADKELRMTTIWDEGTDEEAAEQPVQIDELNSGVNLQQAANEVYLPDRLVKPLIAELRDYLKRTETP